MVKDELEKVFFKENQNDGKEVWLTMAKLVLGITKGIY